MVRAMVRRSWRGLRRRLLLPHAVFLPEPLGLADVGGVGCLVVAAPRRVDRLAQPARQRVPMVPAGELAHGDLRAATAALVESRHHCSPTFGRFLSASSIALRAA